MLRILKRRRIAAVITAVVMCFNLIIPAQAENTPEADYINADYINTVQIEVFAKVISPAALTVASIPETVEIPNYEYDVDISWNTMEFVYSFNADYGTGLGWQTTDLDGVNNNIKITNRSTEAIDASLLYTMDTSDVFNEDDTSDTAVRGGFYKTNNDALAASGAPTNDDVMPAVSLTLGNNSVSPTADFFFAFTGEPDCDERLVNLQRVGVITVSVRPAGYYYSPEGERFFVP